MANILTAAEAANVLRVETTDANMLALLPGVDDYIKNATGHDWAAEAEIPEAAKNAARMLIVRWYEDPGGMAAGAALGFGLSACLAQLEAMALAYYEIEGLSSGGYISLPAAREGDTVDSVTGLVNTSGDQSTLFEATISEDGYILQTSSSDLDEKYYRVHLTHLGEK